jgi:DNA polymerase III subunit chi
MTDIKFYQLTTTPLEKALPQILRKVMDGGRRAVIQFNDVSLLKNIDDMLWVFSQKQPIPHGTKQDGFESEQPLYLTILPENPNNAESLINIGNNEIGDFSYSFSQYIDIFNGNSIEELENARARYKAHTKAQKEVIYYKQDEKGGWIKG